METKEKRTQAVSVLLGLAGLLLAWTFATAGDLEPSGPPGSTMKTLNEIYDAASIVSQREGYISHIDMTPSSSMTLFTVPTGKKFVLLKMVLWNSQTYLTKNGSFLTGGGYELTADGFDFPDRCVVLDEGDSFGIVNPYGGAVKAVVIGYFFDI
jgi:hypothetical protein